MANNLVMRIIMAASDRASAAFNRVRQAGGSLTAALQRNQQALQQTERAQRDLARAGQLRAQLSQTSRELLENSRRQRELRQAIRASGQATREQERELQNLERRSRTLRHTQERQTQELEQLRRRLREAGVSTRDLAAAEEELRRRHERATREIERQRNALNRLNRAQASVSRARQIQGTASGIAVASTATAYGIARGIGAPVKAAIEEEDAMLGIIKQVQGLKNADNSLNHAEIAKVRAEIRGLSRDLPVATTEIMAMYEAGARMDVPREELGAYVKTAAVAATAFDAEDMGQLAENLGRINKNFKLSAEQGRALADVINYLDDNSLSKGANIIEYMNRVSGSMGLAKISDKNTAALGSTLLTAGVDASTSANAVSSLFTRLSTAPDMKPVREALKGLGLDAKAIQKGMVEDANATVMKVMEAVKKMPKEQQAGFLKGLAGGEYNKVFAALISNTEEWRRQLELANSEEAKGSMMREFETRAGALSSKWQIFKNQLFGTAALMGQTLFPAIQDLLQIGERWLTNTSKWVQENPKLAGTLMKVAAVIGILAAALAVVATIVAAVVVPLAMLKLSWVTLATSAATGAGSLAKVGTVLKIIGQGLMWLGRLFLANPIGLAITLIVAGLYLLWRHWDTVKAALIAGWNWINQVFSENPILNFVFAPIGIMRLLVNNWSSIVAYLKSTWEMLKGLLGDNPIVQAIIRPITPLASLKERWESFKTAFGQNWEWLKGILRDNPLLGAFMGPIGLITTLIANIDRLIAKAGQVKKAFENINIADKINAPFRRIGNLFDGKGFSRGGYTGAGGINEAAGIVHRGEVVFSQADVRRFGGWQAVEALRRGGASALAGIKGILPASERRAPSGFAGSLKAAAPGGDHIVININGSGMDAQAVAREVARQLDTRSRERQSRARSSYYDQD